MSISFFVNLSTWEKQSLLVFIEIHSQIQRNILQFSSQRQTSQTFGSTSEVLINPFCCQILIWIASCMLVFLLQFAILVGPIHTRLTISLVTFFIPRSEKVCQDDWCQRIFTYPNLTWIWLWTSSKLRQFETLPIHRVTQWLRVL